MKAAAAFSLLSLVTLLGSHAGARSEVPPRDQLAGDDLEGTAPDTVDVMSGTDPYIEGNIDYDVSYDDSVAQSYDDGYDPGASAQFDETLSPYGTWIDDDTYGRVWQPAAVEVGAEFSPYSTGGRWTMTEYGWTWISDWDWGWAPFHYGRWMTLGNRGWCWLPGTLWGPAWVSWRAGGGYVGWAPLPPRHVTIGSPLGARSGWRFTLAGDLGRGHARMLPPQIVPRIFGRMTVVSNARALPIPGHMVRVNVGPALAGAVPGRGGSSDQVRLAAIAPHALPRLAIEPHPGTPAVARPWMRAASSGFSDRPYAQRAAAGDPRARFAPPAQGFPRASVPTRAFNPSAVPMNRRGAAIHAAPMAGYRAPIYRDTIFRSATRVPSRTLAPGSAPISRAAPPVAPRPWGGSPSHVSGSSFSGPGHGGGGRSFRGGSSFSGGAGGRPLGGGGRSLTGGSSLGGTGGRSFGGGRSLGGGRH